MPKPEGASLSMALGVGVAAAVTGILLVGGSSEDSVRMAVRATARAAVLLFLLAFSASSLVRLWPGPATKALLRNRRAVGVGFAIVHFLHLGTLVLLGVAYPQPFLGDTSAVTWVGGGLAYAFIGAMALTSTDRAVARLGRRRWSRLHTIGAWYVWLIFAQSYVPRAVTQPLYAPFALLIFAAVGARIAARLALPRASASP